MIKREAHELNGENFDAFVTDPENKMVVVDFYAPWCHWCQILEPTWKNVARDAPEKPWGKDTRVTKVNCEANRELCMKHNIRAYPTINIYIAVCAAAASDMFSSCHITTVYRAQQLQRNLTMVIAQLTPFLSGLNTNTKS